MILLVEKATDCGIHLSSSEIDRFQRYLLELWEWNKRFNLTGLKTEERIVIELFLDSLIPAAYLPEQGTLLDIGSGAGFPGLPLKILHPGLQAVLLESNSKKVSFLNHVIRLLNLRGAQAVQGRIALNNEWFSGKGFRVITARALADLRQIVLWCSTLLEPGGLLVTFLGAGGEKAVEANEKTMADFGLQVERHLSYLLPGKESLRHTFILKKQEAEQT